MKKIILLMLTCFSLNVSAQWGTKEIQSEDYGLVKVAYTKGIQPAYLKLETIDSTASLYIGGIYLCSKPVTVEITIIGEDDTTFYTKLAPVNKRETVAFISWDIKNEPFFDEFKNSSSIKVHVINRQCSTDETYIFKMHGILEAVDFLFY